MHRETRLERVGRHLKRRKEKAKIKRYGYKDNSK